MSSTKKKAGSTITRRLSEYTDELARRIEDDKRKATYLRAQSVVADYEAALIDKQVAESERTLKAALDSGSDNVVMIFHPDGSITTGEVET